MNSSAIWHATLHEMRTLRRLIRTHIFIWIALLICIAYFLVVTHNHMRNALEIPMLGVISPRYIMSLLGGSFLALFCTGVLLLTFDQVKRDKICRIHEVVSSKPVSNVELYLGRLLGVSVIMTIPMLFVLFSSVIYGFVAETFSIKFGEPVEFWSVISFIFLDIVPNFLFFGSLVILFSTLSKSRLLALLFTLGCLYVLFWLNSRLSLDITRPLQTVSGNVLFPSEVIPTLFTPVIVFNRIALVLMSFGFLYGVSYFSSRVTSSEFKDLLMGSVSFCVGALVIVALFGVQSFERTRIDEWVKEHDEHFLPNAFPDVLEIRGRIDIKPGRSLSLDLTLDVRINTVQDSDSVLFSLNPGYRISQLAVAGEAVLDYEFRHGLLRVPRMYFATMETTEMILQAHGRPDERFAYLDSRETLARIVGPSTRQLRQLGTENFIFRSEFVALLPGVKWYPTAGTATNEDAWELRKKDFFTLEIDVSVPRHWLVAGPAKRELLEDSERTIYRFQQSSPLPEIALVGSKFESASMEVEEVSFEVLYSKTHRQIFERFAPAEDVIRNNLNGIMTSIHSNGFEYPYGAYTLVEVPSTLRVFGGGLHMDSVMCPPGIVMVRESTLPTMPADFLIGKNFKQMFEEHNLPQETWYYWEVNALASYLNHPMFESNANSRIYQSILSQQTSATHDGAHALNILLELLIGAVFPRTEAEFEFQLALDRQFMNLASVEPFEALRSLSDSSSTNTQNTMFLYHQKTLNSPSAWDSAERLSLFEQVQGQGRTLTLRGMKLRSQQLVQWIVDTFGNENIAPILVDFANRFRGKNFVFEDFVNVFAEHGLNLKEESGGLLASGGVPGFFVANPLMRRIGIDDQIKYETTFVIRNGEPVSGPIRLSLRYQNEVNIDSPYSSFPLTTMLVGGHQTLKVVFESSNPVQQIWVKPYLSRNRMDLRLDVPLSEEWKEQEFVQNEQPFIKSIEVVEQTHQTLKSFTVDDLDPGFSVLDPRKTSTPSSAFSQFFRKLLGEDEEVPMDNGLPKYSLRTLMRQRGWHRWTDPTAFGHYRRTFAISRNEGGLAFAKFANTLPHIGSWMLEYYLPAGYWVEEVKSVHGSGWTWSSHFVGSFDIEIRVGSTLSTHTFDAPNAPSGWNIIGTFDLPDPEVDVLISNKTKGMYVFADAIRWTPVENEE